MRISDCADLTGTTVRTIRYYHQIGLLPVPERWGGRRDYELEHVARLLRIRWLADAGLGLDQVRSLLADEEHQEGEGGQGHGADVLRDLRATAAGLEERIAELQAQRDRVSALLEMAQSGRGLQALPPGMDRFYDHLARRVSDPATLEVLRREQRLAELFAQRGLVPASFERLIQQLTEEDLAVIIDFYTGYAHLGELGAAEAAVETDRLVSSMTTWCTEHPHLTREAVLALPRWSRTPAALRSLIRLSSLFATDRRQAQVLHGLIPVVTDLLAPAPHTPDPDDHDLEEPA